VIRGQVHFSEAIGYLGRTFEIKMVRLGSQHLHEITVSCTTPVVAAQTIANIVKSSLGPMGLDKMLVDNIGVWFYDRWMSF
jgi:hypothetical protein